MLKKEPNVIDGHEIFSLNITIPLSHPDSYIAFIKYVTFEKRTNNVSLRLLMRRMISRLFCVVILAGVMRRKSIYWQHLIQITTLAPVKYKNWTAIFILAFTLSL